MNNIKNASDKTRVFWNSFFMNLASIVEKAAFFIMTVVIARYLSMEHYGEYVTAMGLATFFAMISNLSINISIIRAINKYREEKNYYFSIAVILKLLLSFISYGLLIVFLYSFDYNESTRRLAVILGLVRIATECISTLYAFMEADERFDILAVLISVFSTAILAGTVGVIMLKGDYYQIVDVRLIITALFFTVIFIIIQRKYTYQFSMELSKNFIRSAVPFAGTFAASNIVVYSAILFLPLLADTVSAGVYQNAFIFIGSIGFVVGNLIKVLMPYLYKYEYKANREKFGFAFQLYSKIFAIMAFYILLVVLLYAHIIIPLVFGKKYSDSIGVLKILSLAIPFLFSVGAAIITTVDKQKALAIFNGAGALFAVITSYFFIILWGVQGAAWSYAGTVFLLYVASHLYLSIKGYVRYLPAFITIVETICVSIFIYLIFHYILVHLNVFLSAFAMTALYAVLVFLFVVKKGDIRIVREIFGI